MLDRRKHQGSGFRVQGGHRFKQIKPLTCIFKGTPVQTGSSTITDLHLQENNLVAGRSIATAARSRLRVCRDPLNPGSCGGRGGLASSPGSRSAGASRSTCRCGPTSLAGLMLTRRIGGNGCGLPHAGNCTARRTAKRVVQRLQARGEGASAAAAANTGPRSSRTNTASRPSRTDTAARSGRTRHTANAAVGGQAMRLRNRRRCSSGSMEALIIHRLRWL